MPRPERSLHQFAVREVALGAVLERDAPIFDAAVVPKPERTEATASSCQSTPIPVRSTWQQLLNRIDVAQLADEVIRMNVASAAFGKQNPLLRSAGGATTKAAPREGTTAHHSPYASPTLEPV